MSSSTIITSQSRSQSSSQPSREERWWTSTTVYQIWPMSYRDSDGDGIGDIPGIIETLPYLSEDLGVETIWLSPMYDGPQVDFGYDIADYQAIYPPFGTLADMDLLIAKVHERGMRLLIDLVVNHTSDQHAWFLESRASKAPENEKRAWYIWRPPRYVVDPATGQRERRPPNNWRSLFGGSAWEWDESTQEYYLHLFAVQQPDLNWENPATREAIYDTAIRFWLDRGIDGFRVDTANFYSKVPGFEDAPITDPDAVYQPYPQGFCNGPRIHDFWKEMSERALARADRDVVTVGECAFVTTEEGVLEYVGASQKKMSMLFQFDVVELGKDYINLARTVPWTLPEFKKPAIRWQQFIEDNDGWTTIFLENHDQGRSITRFASDHPDHRTASGKMLALFQTTSTGTLFIYQGQEIGMINAPVDWPIEEFRDIDTQNKYQACKERCNNDPQVMAQFRQTIHLTARDHARTPVQWDDSNYAGFSTAKPWMRVHDEYRSINVKEQLTDPDSVLLFWKRMLKFRKEYKDLFVFGRIRAHDVENLFTFTYVKESIAQKRKALVSLNFSPKEQPVMNPFSGSIELKDMKLLVSTNMSSTEISSDNLAPYEGRVYLIE